jgi:ketol-acid reductoisomerase
MFSVTRICNNLSKFSRSVSSLKLPEFNIDEKIYNRNDYRFNNGLKNKKISIIGYGPQGKSQSLNLRDNQFNVCIGVREGKSYDLALKDGWIPNENLFSIPEAVDKGHHISYLLSDAGQISQWDEINPYLTEGKTLCFSHGFGIVYNELTNIKPPDNIDVIMVAPKGAGLTVRKLFLENKGINSSFAIHNDYSGKAKEICLQYTFGIGSAIAFETTFENEVYSDLLGERCVLMGLIQGAFKAQYNVLRKNGHSPSEAYNETVEEALVSLYPLINNKGMDWMYENCSTTAQRGALDWAPRFEKCMTHLISECYEEVKNGNEAKKVINSNSDPDYREKLNQELEVLKNQELWQVSKVMRNLRFDNYFKRRIN